MQTQDELTGELSKVLGSGPVLAIIQSFIAQSNEEGIAPKSDDTVTPADSDSTE